MRNPSTGLKCSGNALDKLRHYMQTIKAHIFLLAREMVCLLKIRLAQETQSLFDFLMLALITILHFISCLLTCGSATQKFQWPL